MAGKADLVNGIVDIPATPTYIQSVPQNDGWKHDAALVAQPAAPGGSLRLDPLAGG